MTVLKQDTAGSAAETKHPFDYYYREGMPLRPRPEAAAFAPDLWVSGQHERMFAPWVSVQQPLGQTPLTRLVDDHRWQGDELMDAVVLAFRRIGMSRGRRLLDQALDDGIASVTDPPPELVDLFAQLDNPPDWFDPDVWERGRRLAINASLSGRLVTFSNDWMLTFVGSEVSSATGQTGRFLNQTWKRLLESVTWFTDVTRPEAIDRHSPVFKDIVRVRLMHAQARVGLRETWGDEHFARHGSPISNSMTMAGAVSFALLAPLLDHGYGRRISVEDLDAVMSYWSYIAYLMGVADELIPRNAIEGLEIAQYMVMTTGGPTEWTAHMVNAACDAILSGNPIVRSLQLEAFAPVFGLLAALSGEPLVRAMLQDSPAASIRLQPWQSLAGAAVKLEVLRRRLDDHLPFAARRTEWRTRHVDRRQELLVWLSAVLASRRGVSDTPYDHHDSSVDIAAGCPAR
jgi:hypothetical protein